VPMGSRNRIVVIMAKAPRAGSVKTRLAEKLSLEAVTELYRCFLKDTVALAQTLVDANVLLMCPESDVEELSLAVDRAAPVVAQTGRGLAAALTTVFAVYASSGENRVIAFNSERIRDFRDAGLGCGAHIRRRLLSCRGKGVSCRTIHKRSNGNRKRA
jgi:uncharacterized protein